MERQTTRPYLVPAGTRILCVDDESMIGELVAQILRSQLRCEVVTARNGVEALEVLETDTDFGIVVIDYVMPRMDGGELYRQLEQKHPGILDRVLFITGDILTESTLSYINSTGKPLLEKPFGLPELTSAIRDLLPAARP